jgi:DNA helicase-2/ATP-dependent DNA helicase PcrA
MRNIILEQLTDSQKRAVFHVEGPLLVIAGPGSGKTRVITYRIAALIEQAGVRPSNICAITFTNKAAEEMRQRAVALGASGGAHISTFHSLCVRILRQYALRVGVKANFSIYDAADQARCVRHAVKECNIDSTNFPPARMLDAISSLKNRLIDVESLKAEADNFFTKNLARVYEHYQSILAENNALDFDDLLMKAAFLLEGHTDVRRELGDHFKFLLIDEYQDTNHAQYRIAKALVSSHNNICATGDPDQSIYGWRGADIHNILAFEKDWPNVAVVKLEENFRSTPNILRAADHLIAFNKNRKEKKLVPVKEAGQDVAVKVFEDEHYEAIGISGKIQELIANGARPNQIAVFYRVNSMSRVFEEALIQNKIPYQILRGVEFYNRKEIRDVIAYLKVLANPEDQTALLRIINTPARGIGKTTVEKAASYSRAHNISLYEGLRQAKQIDSLGDAAKAKVAVFIKMMEEFKKASGGPVAALAERVYIESGMKKFLQDLGIEGQSALENVDELINAAAQYDQQTAEPSLLDYLQQISLFSDVDTYDAASERVVLMTLHSAKGLEFENVFIAGVEGGLLPHERSTTDADEIEEERRLLFVGMTRAKSNLQISYANYRTVHGQLLHTIPSQFLFELGVEIKEDADEGEDTEDADLAAGLDMDTQIAPEFFPGQRVVHKSFGRGIVQEFIGMGENSVVVVKFSAGQTKSLMVKYAALSVVEDI